jgi:hypothetical protein
MAAQRLGHSLKTQRLTSPPVEHSKISRPWWASCVDVSETDKGRTNNSTIQGSMRTVAANGSPRPFAARGQGRPLLKRRGGDHRAWQQPYSQSGVAGSARSSHALRAS